LWSKNDKDPSRSCAASGKAARHGLVRQYWPASPNRVAATPHAGKFVVGHNDATIDATTNVCNLVGCAPVSTTQVIRLTR
jgi:hypothetical protein